MVKSHAGRFDSADAFGRIVAHATHPSTIFPQRILIQPPHTAVPQEAYIYARGEAPTADWLYVFRARFTSPQPVASGDGQLLESEFVILVDHDLTQYELTFHVSPTSHS
jgi:hypothetical protein